MHEQGGSRLKLENRIVTKRIDIDVGLGSHIR